MTKNKPADAGLLDTRQFTIVTWSLLAAIATGFTAGISASSSATDRLLIGAIVGISVGLGTFFGTAATLNGLIKAP